MMSLGRNWDPATGYEKRCRTDGSEPPPLPFAFAWLAHNAIKAAQPHLDDQLPLTWPDVCLANFYQLDGRLAPHQDCDESSDSLAKGLPVVSIFIGCSAEFWYGHNTRDENMLRRVILDSGDVLIFGGKSRLIFHGVKQISRAQCSMAVVRAIRIQPGCLNLTLKRF
ncbi:putative DNA oxidative demethylase [Helianthus annuus]|nr:putative DNA oxidative demethylase [Helianthus annuus]